MPNWCDNLLVIKGDSELIEKFKKSVKGYRAVYHSETNEEKREPQLSEFTFNSLVPVPEEILKKGFSDAGYEWQSDNWGTKWDVYSVEIISEKPNEINYLFSTAWSPALPWIRTVSSVFPDLEFELSFFEPNMVFAGTFTFEEGEVINQEEHQFEGEGIKKILIEKMGLDKDEVDKFIG